MEYYAYSGISTPRLLQPSTTYQFRVKARNRQNSTFSPWSDIISFATREAALGEVRLQEASLQISEKRNSVNIVVSRHNGLHGELYAKLIVRQSDDPNVRTATDADFTGGTTMLIYSTREKKNDHNRTKPDQIFEYPDEQFVVELQSVTGKPETACVTGAYLYNIYNYSR